MKALGRRECSYSGKKGGNLKQVALTVAILCLLQPVAYAQTVSGSEAVQGFDIPAQPLASALREFAKQSRQELLFSPEVVAGKTTGGIKENLPPLEALSALLQNTNVSFSMTHNGAILLRDRVAKGETSASVTIDSDPQNSGMAGKQGVRSAQDSEDTAHKNQSDPSETSPEAVNLDTIVVTGTRIRGGNPTSPVHTITRSDIEQSGYSQIGDVIRSLPENFSGGQNPGVIAASQANRGNLNVTNASTINLRGLGSDATLVLINGHRLSADYAFQGSDISGIPLSAVQRIEVVADGASALYGSDAVAGVANIILRDNYDGTELTARVGGATQGGGFEQTYSLLTGKSGKNGYFLANFEFDKQDGITAGDRDFTAAVTPATTLWAPQTRRSAFISFGRDLREGLSVAIDALWSDRDMTSLGIQSNSSYDSEYLNTYTPAYNVTAKADLDLPQSWQMHVTGGLAGSRNKIKDVYAGIAYPSATANNLRFAEITADGSLLDLPGGPLKVALGGGIRTEGFRDGFKGEADTLTPSRQVTYAYAEALAPLVTPSPERTGLHELELNLSARTERYSDFGTTTNPKVGVRYVPLTDLTLRASWGKSFKAPSFLQLYQDYGLTLYKATSMGYSGPSTTATALLVFGGNVDLQPEKSTSWTFGVDYHPSQTPSLTLSATYFDVDYTDRVVQPINPTSAALSNSQFEPFVALSPSSTELDALFATADYFNNFAHADYDPANVAAIVFNNYQNATAQTAQGIDLAYRQNFDLWGGDIDAFANATWLRLRQQTIITKPVVDLSGTIFNAPNFKARAGVSWQKGNLTASVIANYINGESDTGIIPNQKIASWTTFDATLGYRFGGMTDLARGMRVSLAVSNLFDRDPPYAASPALA